MNRPQHLLRRRGFTLIEATLAISLTAVAASVLLLAVTASQSTTDDALRRTVAAGIAEQLMDEILGRFYCADPANGYETTLGPSTWEKSGVGRQRFNDIDDYNGVRTQPPTDVYGITLGTEDGIGGRRNSFFQASMTLMANWRQEVDVYYVNASNLNQKLTGTQTSGYRVVEVRVTEDVPNVGRREWAKVRRVVAYVPPLS